MLMKNFRKSMELVLLMRLPDFILVTLIFIRLLTQEFLEINLQCDFEESDEIEEKMMLMRPLGI